MKKYLFLPGAAMVIAALFMAAIAGRWTSTHAVLAAGGALALAVAVAANWQSLRAWKHDPRGAFAVNTVTSSMLLVIILGLANAAVSLKQVEFDLTESSRNTIGDDTRALLGKLDRDVAVKEFGRSRDPQVESLLAAFAAAGPRVSRSFVDVERNVQEAKSYGILRNGTVVVEAGGKHRKVERPNELALATAVVQVTTDAERTMCFTTGEGERGLADASAAGLSGLAGLLEASNYKIDRVSLLQSDVPSSCSVLIIPGPSAGMSPEALSRVAAFMVSGGRVALMIDPPVDRAVAEWLAPLGFAVGQGVIIDPSPSGQQVGAGPDSVLAIGFGSHPIAQGFEVAVVFPRAVPLGVDQANAAGRLQGLVATSNRSFERVDLLSQALEPREGRDRKGPVMVAGAASYPRGPEGTALPEARLVVVGDSDFLTNAHLANGLGNRDFAMRTLAWLSGETDVRIVSVADRENRRIVMTEQTRTVMYLVNVFLLPLIPLTAGVIRFLRSRR